jgi:hypothetical protein
MNCYRKRYSAREKKKKKERKGKKTHFQVALTKAFSGGREEATVESPNFVGKITGSAKFGPPGAASAPSEVALSGILG